MDIKQIWQNITPPEGEKDVATLENVLMNTKSKGPIQKIKQNLIISWGWAVLILGLYGYVFFFFTDVYVRTGVALLILFTLYLFWTSIVLYRRINATLYQEATLVETLRNQHALIKLWIRNQELTGVLFYPISITTGFLLGGVIGSGKTADAFIQRPALIWILAGCIIVFTPVSYFITRWMSHVAYGVQLKKLMEYIQSITATEETDI